MNKKLFVLIILSIIVIHLAGCSHSHNYLGIQNVLFSLTDGVLLNASKDSVPKARFYIDKELMVYEVTDDKPLLILGMLQKLDASNTSLLIKELESKNKELKSILSYNSSVYHIDLKGHIYSLCSGREYYLFFQKNGDYLLCLKENDSNNYLWVYRLHLDVEDSINAPSGSVSLDEAISSAIVSQKRSTYEINGLLLTESHTILEDRTISDKQHCLKLISVCSSFGYIYDIQRIEQTGCSIKLYEITLTKTLDGDYSIDDMKSNPVSPYNEYETTYLEKACLEKASDFYESYLKHVVDKIVFE